MKPQLNEKDLLNLIADGDRQAFTLFYTTYLNNVYRYIYNICTVRETSEEIVQDLFLKVWENRANLPYITSLKPYLYRSAKNLLLDHIRKSRVESKVLDFMELNAVSGENYTDNDLVYNEYNRIAQCAIELLPEKRKQIFKLRLNENLSLDEIAIKLSISKSVVKKQLYSGISFVRNYLFKHGEIIVLLFVLTHTFGKIPSQ
ncbi:MAG: hypothetical protein JWQ57_4037 [Mucilaginibacter sp.]|nr:hypothetical protein [Mucilaginibacter sp.]